MFPVISEKFSVFLPFFSFGAGLLGSLAYIRMLGNTIDSMANGAKGFVKYELHPFKLIITSFLRGTHTTMHHFE